MQAQLKLVPAKSAIRNIQTANNSKPQVKQPTAETELITCGEHFSFSTFVR